MTLRLISSPSSIPEVVTLAEAKQHLRVDHSEEDALIAAYLAAAIAAAENHVQRRFTTRVMEYAPALADCRFRRGVPLPLAPVVPAGVTRVQYVPDGQTGLIDWPLNQWLAVSIGASCVVWPRDGIVWPIMEPDAPEPLVITFSVGEALAPPSVKAAVLLMVGDLYRYRETVLIGSASAIPMSATVASLLLGETWS
jgi:hypothetical protein